MHDSVNNRMLGKPSAAKSPSSTTALFALSVASTCGGIVSLDRSLLGDLAGATATQDDFVSTADGVPGGGSDDVPGGFMLDGLDPDHTYEFRFFGSRNTTALRETDYRVSGGNTQTALLRTSGFRLGEGGPYDGNNLSVATIAGVRPDAFGQVFIDLTLTRGTFAYLNVMELAVVPEPSAAWSAAAAAGTLVGSVRTTRRH